jgi:hypothetical protein
MKVLGYFFLSLGSIIALLANTFKNYDLQYAIIYLYNTNLPKVIILNFFISFGVLAYITLGLYFLSKVKTLLGELREIEKLYVIDKMKRKIMEIAFLLILFSQEQLDILFFTELIVLLAISSLHQICNKRSEYVI